MKRKRKFKIPSFHDDNALSFFSLLLLLFIFISPYLLLLLSPSILLSILLCFIIFFLLGLSSTHLSFLGVKGIDEWPVHIDWDLDIRASRRRAGEWIL